MHPDQVSCSLNRFNFFGRISIFILASTQKDIVLGLAHAKYTSSGTFAYWLALFCVLFAEEAPPGLPTYLPAPPALDEFTSGAPVASVSLPGQTPFSLLTSSYCSVPSGPQARYSIGLFFGF